MIVVNVLWKKIGFHLLMISLCLSAALNVSAKPDLKPLGENIADQGSQYYQFKVQNFQSADRLRNYKVWLAIPKHHNKNQSLPALYLLDGNSVMSRLDEQLLKNLSEHDRPALIAIGYQSNLPFESASRSVDYTPPDESGKIMPDPRNPERMAGGSHPFRQVIFEQIIPWVNTQVKLDMQRTALWGHSYGGLFVLDTVLNAHQNEQRFSHYFAASPSLTWADSRMLKGIQNAQIDWVKGQKLLVMEGDLIQSKGERMSPNADSLMIENNRQTVRDLADKGVEARLMLYPHLSHGQVFQASLMDVLNNRLF